MQHWHLIYTKPNKETLVVRQLEQRDLEVYFPALQFARTYNRGIALEPFFPHYVFVKIDLAASNATGIRWLAGVRTIVEIDSQPVIVPEAVIQSLHKRLDPVMTRVLRKSEWLFRPGQTVYITGGPLKGFSAVFQKGLSGEQRVQILLNFLGSSIRTTVNVDHIALPSQYPV
jgi:transcriptional antiterminator RfaH